MAALGRLADVTPGLTAALTDTGHSEPLKTPELNGSLRPKAAIPLIMYYIQKSFGYAAALIRV